MADERNDHIMIEKKDFEGKPAVEINMYGDVQVLYSMLYCAMKANRTLAEIVIKSAHSYVRSEERESSMN